MEGSLHKQITLVGDPSLDPKECRILWPDGGIICNQADIVQKTFSIMQEALAERGVSVHDEGMPPSTDNDTIPEEDDNHTGES